MVTVGQGRKGREDQTPIGPSSVKYREWSRGEEGWCGGTRVEGGLQVAHRDGRRIRNDYREKGRGYRSRG